MIVRNGHQTAELIRKGRRVDYVYRAGKRIFGNEGVDFLYVKNFSVAENFPLYYENITLFTISKTISSLNILQVVDITNNDINKSFLAIREIENNKYELIFISHYYGNNTTLVFPNIRSMFRNVRSLATLKLNSIMTGDSLLASTFAGCEALTTLEIDISTTNKEFYLNSTFQRINISAVNFSFFKPTKIIYMISVFAFSKVEIVDLSMLDFSGTISFSELFYYSRAKNVDLGLVNSSEVVNIANMFNNCQALTNINLDECSYIRASSLRNIFTNCIRLKYFNCKKLNVDNVEDMQYSFYNTGIEIIDLSEWNLSNCISAQNAFGAARFLVMKTPRKSAAVDIALPSTFYLEDGSVYGNKIPANTEGSVTIYRTPPTS